MLVIYPFEEKWYNDRGVNAKFVGHPIFNNRTPTNREIICHKLNIDRSKTIITLYPGSRQQEINRHLPILIDVVTKLKTKINNIIFILGVAQNVNINNWKILDCIKIERKYPQMALECADLAIVSSGSSTIEAAIFSTPMIIIYKMSIFSWWIANILVKVKYAGMVNILADSMIMPEVLQNDLKPQLICDIVENIIYNPKKINQMKLDLSKIQNILQSANYTKTAAEYIIEISNKNVA